MQLHINWQILCDLAVTCIIIPHMNIKRTLGALDSEVYGDATACGNS